MKKYTLAAAFTATEIPARKNAVIHPRLFSGKRRRNALRCPLEKNVSGNFTDTLIGDPQPGRKPSAAPAPAIQSAPSGNQSGRHPRKNKLAAALQPGFAQRIPAAFSKNTPLCRTYPALSPGTVSRKCENYSGYAGFFPDIQR